MFMQNGGEVVDCETVGQNEGQADQEHRDQRSAEMYHWHNAFLVLLLLSL